MCPRGLDRFASAGPQSLMRFDRNIPPNPYLNRRDQWRLLRLVGMVAVVMALFQVARQPASWDWFTRMGEVEPTVEPGRDLPVAPSKPIAVKGRAPAPLPDDQIYAWVDGAAAGPVASEEEGAASPPVATGDGAAGVTKPGPRMLPAEVFEGIEDDWFGMTRAEQPALLKVLDHLREMGPAAVASGATRDVTFEGLMGNPDYYRGRLVTLSGRLKRCLQGQFGSGETSQEVWEAWIVPPDSRGTPYLVYCLEVPPGMPTGEKLDEPVLVHGCFVRRFAYASIGGEAITPMVVGLQLEWAPAPLRGDERITEEMRWSTVVLALIFTVALLGTGVWYWLSDRRFRNSRLHTIGESRLDASSSDLQALSNLDRGDPHRIHIPDNGEDDG